MQHNGFEIAEEDFRLRCPGDVLGTAQSGLGAVQFAEWLSDTRLIHRANRDANAILDADPMLKLPQHAPLRELVQFELEQGVDGQSLISKRLSLREQIVVLFASLYAKSLTLFLDVSKCPAKAYGNNNATKKNDEKHT